MVVRTLCGCWVNTGAVRASPTERSTTVAVEPAALVAVTTMAWRPAAIGVPESTPVAASSFTPAGSESARKEVGELAAVSARENASPTRARATELLANTGGFAVATLSGSSA